MRTRKKCPICQSEMKRLYERCIDTETRKTFWAGVAWICENPACMQIIRDDD